VHPDRTTVARPAARDACRLVETLYREHRRRVLVVCRALLRDNDEAEDAAQQVFLSAYRSLLNGVVPRQPEAWLVAIARNECHGRRATSVVSADDVDDRSIELPDAVIRRDELAALWRIGARYEPRIARDEADRLQAEWRAAVRRALP
jgi:DNA-directed RNA polymerase specialized sigma24 family protein